MPNKLPVLTLTDLPIATGEDNLDGSVPHMLWCIAGPRKTGKSLAASTWPRPLFLDFEDRSSFIDCARLYILRNVWVSDGQGGGEWVPFEETKRGTRLTAIVDSLRLVAESLKNDPDHKFETVILDTADRLFDTCYQAYLFDSNLDTKPTQSFQTWNSVYSLVKPILEKFRGLTSTGYHVVYVLHTDDGFQGVGSEEKSYKLMLPPHLNMYLPSLSQCNLFIKPTSKANEHHRFVTKSNPTNPAGDGTGRLPASLPTTYQAIAAAFSNDEPEDYQPTYRVFKSKRGDLAPNGKPAKRSA